MGYFKSFFGPSRDEIWSALRAEIGGEIVEGGFCRGAKLQASAGEWTVSLDEYTQVILIGGKHPMPIQHTRMRAPFPNPSGFRFSIHRASVFSYIGKVLGLQDIEVGYPQFDEDFVIKSNNEQIVKSLCRSEQLRALITAQPKFQLSVQDDEGWFGQSYPDDVDILVFDVVELIRDVERLKSLYDVFAETLHRLSGEGVTATGRHA